MADAWAGAHRQETNLQGGQRTGFQRHSSSRRSRVLLMVALSHSQPFGIVDGKHFGEDRDEGNVLPANNYEALSHSSSQTQFMLCT